MHIHLLTSRTRKESYLHVMCYSYYMLELNADHSQYHLTLLVFIISTFVSKRSEAIWEQVLLIDNSEGRTREAEIFVCVLCVRARACTCACIYDQIYFCCIHSSIPSSCSAVHHKVQMTIPGSLTLLSQIIAEYDLVTLLPNITGICTYHNILAQLSVCAVTILKRHVITLNGFPFLCIFTSGNYTGRFIMYSGITKIYYRKTVGHVFRKPVQKEGTTENYFPSKLFFIVVHISATRRCECM